MAKRSGWHGESRRHAEAAGGRKRKAKVVTRAHFTPGIVTRHIFGDQVAYLKLQRSKFGRVYTINTGSLHSSGRDVYFELPSGTSESGARRMFVGMVKQFKKVDFTPDVIESLFNVEQVEPEGWWI